MEPTILAMGKQAPGILRQYRDETTVSAREVIVRRRDPSTAEVSCDRRIHLGSSERYCKTVELTDGEVPPGLLDGYTEIRDEVENTDFVVLTSLLGELSGTYLSRYVASLVHETSVLGLAIMGGTFSTGNGLEARRARSSYHYLDGVTDYFLPVDAANAAETDLGSDSETNGMPGCLTEQVGALLAKVIYRINHGSNTIGNLERLVHSDERSKGLLRNMVL